MKTYAINQPIRMTKMDITLLENATGAIIDTEPGRIRVTIEDWKFPKFVGLRNSYIECARNPRCVEQIRNWRESIQKEFAL